MAPPTEQQAVIFEANGAPLKFGKIKVGKPDFDEVLIRIKYSGVCHTDLHAWKGDWPIPTRKPCVGGHEGVGTVVAVGDQVKDPQIGDVVGLKWLNGACGSCEMCLLGHESNCPNATFSGYTVDGSFQQYAIGKAHHVARLPKDADQAAAAPIMCAGITVYKALKVSECLPGQWVAIPGAGGGLGHIAVQYAKAMGMRVVAIDGGDEKKKLCEKLGAETFIDFTQTKDIVAAVKKATNGGAHTALIVATSEKPYTEALQYLRPQGVMSCVALPANAFIKAEVFWTVLNCLKIKGSHVGTRADTVEAIDFFSRGLVTPIYQLKGLSELDSIYHDMEQGRIAGRIVVDCDR